MIGIKDIQNKIKSINNTQKITKAMEMVSIVKMRKIKKQMNNSRPYFEVINKIIAHMQTGNLEFSHTFFKARKVKRIGMIVVSTDRGLCGNLNTLLFKKILQLLKKYEQKNIFSDLSIIGLKGLSFFNSISNNIIYHINNLSKDCKLENFIGSINALLKLYNSKKIDKLFLAYNKFKSTIIHSPTIVQLLPFLKKQENIIVNNKWDYIYESDTRLLLTVILNRYIESQVYQSILENLTCEQAARMLAMKKATDNSTDLIKELQISYNKVRQSNITQELTEIISGASVVSLN